MDNEKGLWNRRSDLLVTTDCNKCIMARILYQILVVSIMQEFEFEQQIDEQEDWD
jgi:hypothetical protein